jgi:hypothetical protein
MDNGVGRWDDKYGHAHCECGLGKHDCCDEPPGDHIRQGVEQQQALVARLQEAEAEKQAMPAHLAQRSSDWLSSNEKQPAEVRWGRFPLGMVQRWVERAEIAEARLQEAEKVVEAARIYSHQHTVMQSLDLEDAVRAYDSTLGGKTEQ